MTRRVGKERFNPDPLIAAGLTKPGAVANRPQVELGAPKHAPEKLAYSIAGLCAASGLGRSLIYQHISLGLLRTTKAGRRTIILRADAEAWLVSLRNTSAPSA